MTPVLEIKGLRKNYPGFALNGIDLTIEENCITGFIGKNGAGKTTTIRCILGLTKKDGGTIRLFGQDTDVAGAKLLDRVSVVFDEGQFFEDLTLRDMKKIVAAAYSKWSDKTFTAHMDAMGLDETQKIKTLSRGMRMKYGLCLALSHEADLLILDEPTSGLDPQVRKELMDQLLDYVRQDGKSVFFSTHVTSDLERAADTLIMIDGGNIVFTRDKVELLDTHRLVKGDPALLEDPDFSRLLLGVERTPYAFTGLTDQPAAVKALRPDVLLERPDIETIMLAHLQR